MGSRPILAQIPKFGKIQGDGFNISPQVAHLRGFAAKVRSSSLTRSIPFVLLRVISSIILVSRTNRNRSTKSHKLHETHYHV
jgi:hypothetical protein